MKRVCAMRRGFCTRTTHRLVPERVAYLTNPDASLKRAFEVNRETNGMLKRVALSGQPLQRSRHLGPLGACTPGSRYNLRQINKYTQPHSARHMLLR
jgi:hypothetical protein